jgi:hypothetical protein
VLLCELWVLYIIDPELNVRNAMIIEASPTEKKQEISSWNLLSVPEIFALIARRIDAMPLADKLIFNANDHVINTSITNMQQQIADEAEMERLDAIRREKMRHPLHCCRNLYRQVAHLK